MHLILKIGISRNTECVNTVGFPKLGHIYRRWLDEKIYKYHMIDEKMAVLFKADGRSVSIKTEIRRFMPSEFFTIEYNTIDC